MRSASDPDPNSMTTTPAVAWGTKTTSRPSPSQAANCAQASVRSTRPRRCPVWIVSSAVFTLRSDRPGEGRASRLAFRATARLRASRFASERGRSPLTSRFALREEVTQSVTDARRQAAGRGRREAFGLAVFEVLGTPVQQANGRAVGRVHDVVGEPADASRAGHADGHVQDFATERRRARQLSCAAGEYDARREQPLAGTSNLSPQHLEDLAHPGFDDLADLEPAEGTAVRLPQHRDADELVGSDAREIAGTVLDLEILRHLQAGLETDGKVVGDVVAANRKNGRLEGRTIEEQGQVDCARSDVGHSHAQVALGFREHRLSRGQRAGYELVDLDVRGLDALGQVPDGRSGGGNDMGLDLAADGAHAKRILHALLTVDDEAAWQDVEDFAVRWNRDGPGHFQSTADVLASDLALMATDGHGAA